MTAPAPIDRDQLAAQLRRRRAAARRLPPLPNRRTGGLADRDPHAEVKRP